MPTVRQKIDERAKTVGNKAANLLELEEFCHQINDQTLPFTVRIPELHTLNHQFIISHLDKNAPRWRTLWDDYVEEQKKAEPGSLSDAARVKLQEIRRLILTTLVAHPLSTEELKQYIGDLPEQSLLMVRSTGKEDTADLANPGGNESIAAVAPNELAISKAIGEVMASYSGEKSLKQRLISNDDITEFPFMPVLLQRMIGEPLSGEKKNDAVICSGVMYTGENGTRIQVAPGHGELIVNSKAPFDTFFVSREQVVYAEIYKKTHRLIPVEIQKKRTLELHNNPAALQNNPAVPLDIAQAIAKVGHLIEQHYGMPMDVEFVYHPKERVLYLVQARPIPKGDLKCVIPSSISPEKLVEVKEKNEWCSAEVITPAGSAVQVITAPKELLICDNIGQALDSYLQQKNSPVKAVIVRKMAPETSHEAAQFNAKAIPVMVVEDQAPLHEWQKQKQSAILIDPQRQQIINFKTNDAQQNNLKQKLYADGIIKDGFFKSPMGAQTTVLPLWNKKIATPSINDLTDTKRKPKEHVAIGELILQINSDDPVQSKSALHQLLGLILEQQDELKQYPYATLPKDKLFSFLKEQIALLESAQPGKKQEDTIWQALHATLEIFYKLASSKKGQQDLQALFQQAIITGAELFLCLKRLSNDSSIQEEYLRLVSKLEALIINPGKAQMFSSSIRQVLQNKKSLENARTYPGFNTLNKPQQNYFVEFFKIEKLALNNNIKKQWRAFIFTCCKEPKKIARLAYIIKFCMTNDIAFDLLNNIFNADYKKRLSHEKILENMIKEIDSTKDTLEKLDFHKKQAILQAWERRIGEWSEPRKFNSLWNEYEREFLPLIQELSIDNTMSNLSKITVLKLVQQMTEIMDRTIKAMKGSPEYKEQLKVQYFSKLLAPYHELMIKWSSMKGVLVYFYDYSKTEMLRLIDTKFKQLQKVTTSNQLNPSGTFNVASARIGSSASFDRQFNIRNVTLEDMFTLFHQNIIASITQLNGKIQMQGQTMKDFPIEIQPLIQELLKVRLGTTGNSQCTEISSHFPIISMGFTLPLQNHAATFFIEYNQHTKKTKFSVNFYGANWDNRMIYISNCARLDAKINDIREITQSFYNGKTLSLEYCWELSPDQIKELAPHIGKQLRYYVWATFNNPGQLSGYETTVSNRIGKSLSYEQTKRLFNNAKKIESTSKEIEDMKVHLEHLKKAMTEFPVAEPSFLKLNEWLAIDVKKMNDPNEIKSLFYKTALELSAAAINSYNNTTSSFFYSTWHAKTMLAYYNFGKNKHPVNTKKTENAKLAQQYELRIKPQLLLIEEGVQNLLDEYEEKKSSTQHYKDAAVILRGVITQINKQLTTLQESSDQTAGKQFIDAFDTLINKALESDLKQHRGIKKGVFGTVWNTLLHLANVVGIIDKQYQHYLMSTASTQRLMNLKNTFFNLEKPSQTSTEEPTPKPQQ